MVEEKSEAYIRAEKRAEAKLDPTDTLPSISG